jgi:hypothetical protein
MPNDDLTPTERLHRVAAILAKGVLRYQQRIRRSESRILAAGPESASECLECAAFRPILWLALPKSRLRDTREFAQSVTAATDRGSRSLAHAH